MKNIFKKILVLLMIVGAVSLTISLVNKDSAFAADGQRYNGGSCPNFLGLTSWDCGVNKVTDEGSLKSGIWQIVANVAADISIIAAYLVLGYVIYGGYLYIFSGGDVGKVTTAKKTLAHAFIGLAIVLSASLIMGTIRVVLVQNGNLANCRIDGSSSCVEPNKLVQDLINWFIAIAGIVSAIFLVMGGISYITSSGDAGKVQKAKQVIIYSLIGLAIVALSAVITAFITNIINQADESAAQLVNETVISKEVYDNKTIY